MAPGEPAAGGGPGGSHRRRPRRGRHLGHRARAQHDERRGAELRVPADRAHVGAPDVRRRRPARLGLPLRLGTAVRPPDGAVEGPECLRPALRARRHRRQRWRHLRGRVRVVDQSRLLPGPARWADLRGHGRCGHTGAGARHGAGLRGDLQPDLRDVRTAHQLDRVQRHRGRHGSGGGPRRRDLGRPAGPRVRLHRGTGADAGLPGRTGPGARVLHGLRRLQHLRRDRGKIPPTSGPTCRRPTHRSTRPSAT